LGDGEGRSCVRSGSDFRPYERRSGQVNCSAMFAAHEVMIDAPIEVVSARLMHLLNRGALRGLSDAAYDGGLQTLWRVGPFGEQRGLSRLVRVRTLEPIRHDETTSIALRWEATGVTGELFPVLDAQLTLSSGGQDRSRLELVGSYRPPLGRLGEVIDRAIMAQVAEATIRSLLERAAAALAAAPSQLSHAKTGPAAPWLPVPNPRQA